jgi:hypothetical protein
MSTRPKRIENAARPAEPISSETASNSEQHNASGSIDLQVNALASVLEVARGRVSAERLAKLAEMEAQLDRLRHAFDTTSASDASASRELKRWQILSAIAAWRGKRGPGGGGSTAADFAEKLVRDVPIEDRPWSHQVRYANSSFYSALNSGLRTKGQNISDLFAIAEGAQGGAIKGRGPKSEAERSAMLEARAQRRRERRRLPKPSPGTGQPT